MIINIKEKQLLCSDTAKTILFTQAKYELRREEERFLKNAEIGEVKTQNPEFPIISVLVV